MMSKVIEVTFSNGSTELFNIDAIAHLRDRNNKTEVHLLTKDDNGDFYKYLLSASYERFKFMILNGGEIGTLPIVISGRRIIHSAV